MGLLDKSFPLAYDEIENISAGVPTKIVSLLDETDAFVTTVVCSGTLYAEYTLFMGGEKIATKRSGPSRNVHFTYANFPLLVDSNIEFSVWVTHYRMDTNADFECGIFGYN